MSAFLYLGILVVLIAVAPPLITRALAGPKSTVPEPDPALFDQARLELVSDPLAHQAAWLDWSSVVRDEPRVAPVAPVIPIQRKAVE